MIYPKQNNLDCPDYDALLTETRSWIRSNGMRCFLAPAREAFVLLGHARKEAQKMCSLLVRTVHTRRTISSYNR